MSETSFCLLLVVFVRRETAAFRLNASYKQFYSLLDQLYATGRQQLV